MSNLKNSEKRAIYYDVCDILREDAYNKLHGSYRGKEKIYNVDWLENKYSLTKEDALSLLQRLIRDEKLEEVEEGKYRAICKCSICGKKISYYCSKDENHHIEYAFGYGSRYDFNRIDMDLCMNCFDDLTDYLLSKARKKCLHNYECEEYVSIDEVYLDDRTKEKLKKEGYKDDEIEDIIPF